MPCSQMRFSDYDTDTSCNVAYSQTSCDMSRYSCNMSYTSGGQATTSGCDHYLSSPNYWYSIRNDEAWMDPTSPESRYIWSYWEKYHYGEEVDLTWISRDLTNVFTLFIEDTHGTDVHHWANPMCTPDETMTHYNIECSEFFTTNDQSCTMQYNNNPCDMSQFTCTRFGMDASGNAFNDDCAAEFDNYDNWAINREHSAFHNTDLSLELPYWHAYWDHYHGIHDDGWLEYWTG